MGGVPLTKPAAAVTDANGQATVYASWNGSTQTVAWELLAGPTRASLSPVSITSRTGFETAIATTAAGPFYEVEAIGAGGVVLDTSAVIRAPQLERFTLELHTGRVMMRMHPPWPTNSRRGRGFSGLESGVAWGNNGNVAV